MKTATPKAPRNKGEKKAMSTAIPIRFDDDDSATIESLATRTRLPKADIIRRALRFAGPKFLSGEVSIMDLTETKPRR